MHSYSCLVYARVRVAAIACAICGGFALTKEHQSLANTNRVVANVYDMAIKSKPYVALCLTGQADYSFGITVANLKDVLINNIRRTATLDIFVFLKGPQDKRIKATMRSLMPVSAHLYDVEPDDVIADAYLAASSGYSKNYDLWQPHSLWIQRYQWKSCWDNIVTYERDSLVQYDFVIRTRPDLLYNAVDIAPHTWPIWSNRNRPVASAFCKRCAEDSSVTDLFLVGPRRVAEVFMSTWSRRQKLRLTNERDMKKHCSMYQDTRDRFECMSIIDLNQHGFKMEALPSKTPFSAWTFRACDMPASPVWIYHYLAKTTQTCITSRSSR